MKSHKQSALEQQKCLSWKSEIKCQLPVQLSSPGEVSIPGFSLASSGHQWHSLVSVALSCPLPSSSMGFSLCVSVPQISS